MALICKSPFDSKRMRSARWREINKSKDSRRDLSQAPTTLLRSGKKGEKPINRWAGWAVWLSPTALLEGHSQSKARRRGRHRCRELSHHIFFHDRHSPLPDSRPHIRVRSLGPHECKRCQQISHLPNLIHLLKHHPSLAGKTAEWCHPLNRNNPGDTISRGSRLIKS